MARGAGGVRGISSRLLEVLQCPVTRERLAIGRLGDGQPVLVNESGTLGYRILEGQPDLWPDSAIKLADGPRKEENDGTCVRL